MVKSAIILYTRYSVELPSTFQPVINKCSYGEMTSLILICNLMLLSNVLTAAEPFVTYPNYLKTKLTAEGEHLQDYLKYR